MRFSIVFLGLTFIATPTLASADLLTRYRDATVAQAEKMQAFLLERVPEIAPVLPDTSWTPELDAAAECTLAGLEAARGAEGAEAYVVALESWVTAPIISMGAMAEGMDPILGDELAMKLAVDCGTMDLGSKQAAESGMLEMLQRPDVMERLMAE